MTIIEELKNEIKEGGFADLFWGEFQKLVPSHLRPKLSVYHVRIMIKAFLTTLNRWEKEHGRD